MSALIFCLILPASIQQSGEWELESDKDGIIVHTRSVEGYSIKEYRATIDVDQGPDDVLAIIMEFGKYNEWIDRCIHSELLSETISLDSTLYLYSHISMPFPFQNRDLVQQLNISRIETGYYLELVSAPEYIPGTENMVRMFSNGHWKFEQLESGKTKITMQFLSDVKAQLPPAIANNAIVKSPIKTLDSLKKRLNKGNP